MCGRAGRGLYRGRCQAADETNPRGHNVSSQEQRGPSGSKGDGFIMLSERHSFKWSDGGAMMQSTGKKAL